MTTAKKATSGIENLKLISQRFKIKAKKTKSKRQLRAGDKEDILSLLQQAANNIATTESDDLADLQTPLADLMEMVRNATEDSDGQEEAIKQAKGEQLAQLDNLATELETRNDLGDIKAYERQEKAKISFRYKAKIITLTDEYRKMRRLTKDNTRMKLSAGRAIGLQAKSSKQILIGVADALNIDPNTL